jgi:hypothetical protein
LRREFRRGLLLVALLAHWHDYPVYGQATTRSDPCYLPLAKASDCNLHGPVNTVERWDSVMDAEGSPVQDPPEKSVVLTFSQAGRLIV